MKKTLVCVNVLNSVDNSVFLTHCQEWYKMGKDFAEDSFIFFTPYRMAIDNCRNLATKLAFENECDYLYFIDDDMILAENTYKSLRQSLESRKADAVMAQTFIRGYPFDLMAFKSIQDDGAGAIIGLTTLKEEDWEGKADKDGLIEVDAFGCACVLIDMNLVKRLQPPYFITQPSQFTEDVYFCLKAKNTLGMSNVHIFVDTKVPTGHLMDKEVLSADNRRKKKLRAEIDFPSLKVETDKAHDRGINYLEQVKELIDLQPQEELTLP